MALYQSSFGKEGQGVSMGSINPKADGKFYKGSFGTFLTISVYCFFFCWGTHCNTDIFISQIVLLPFPIQTLIGAPHVRELLYRRHVEMEETVAMNHPTRNGLTLQMRSFGAGGCIEKKNVVFTTPPKELTKEEKRKEKIKKSVLRVLRKEGFGDVRKDLKVLATLRKEQEESLDQLQKSIPGLSSTLRRLA
jgi:hypothetical protein